MNNIYVTPEEVNEAYHYLANAKEGFASATLRHESAKADFAQKKAAGLLDETISGKNETMRNAAAIEALPLEFSNLEETKIQLDNMKLAYDLCSIEVSRVQALLKLSEIVVNDKA